YWDMVSGSDTNIHVAILSKFPIEARHAYTNDTFLLDGRLFRVDRGFDEVTVRAPDLSFTIIAVHLKSRLRERRVNEAEERFEEARILRNIISQKLRSDPRARLIVLGDFNDTPDSPAMREIIGRGRLKLTDTRPAERNGDDAPAENPRYAPRRIVWTEYYGAEDSYSRIDYILLSPAMARYWLPAETHIVTLPNWGVASDHRPIVAGFDTHGATSP
ncbi:MAG: endonuclease/exonuclease/phosphatase family protein, partial [Verrucomicrobia bacterium]|nr:endonuclease/exonuclease/phosphatase family protein [Verrucomicrobiota bacterium]